MRSPFAALSVALLLAGTLSAGPARAAETLRVSGTGGAMPMMQHIAAGYAAATGNRIEVVSGLGSRGAVRAVADGKLDLAVSARPLDPEEAARGLTAIAFARTALVFITSHPKPNSLNSGDLTGIFRSTNSKWADGSPIHLILRTRFDGDSLILQETFAGMTEALETARQRKELPIAATDQDNAEMAERLPGSFVQAGLSQIKTEKRNLRFVPIDGVEPTLANLESGKYPYVKKFYLVFTASKKAAANSVLDFVRSDKGRAVLRETENLPVTE